MTSSFALKYDVHNVRVLRFISSEFKSKTDICSLSKSPQTNKVQTCKKNPKKKKKSRPGP